MSNKKARPFIKWAGGKNRILYYMSTIFPNKIKNGEIDRYIEPFVGGGSVFFYIANNYKIKEFIINDNNFSLMASYKTIQKDVDPLIKKLSKIKDEYLSLNSDKKKEFYYKKRYEFNQLKDRVEDKRYNPLFIDFTALFIFLNKSCFNGLFRLNAQGEFNVPFGKYNNQTIFKSDNLKNVNAVLHKVKILNADFSEIENYINKRTFLYVDPPYRVKTNNGFLLYNEKIFSWKDQIRLANMIKKLAKNNVKIMVSNANNKDIINLYVDFQRNITYRPNVIAGNITKRGTSQELILTSYKTNGMKLY